MKIDAKITNIVGGEKLKAFASIMIDDVLIIRGIKIIDGVRGRFISMPSRKTQGGRYEDYCYTTTKDARLIIEDAVLKAYAKKLEGCK